VKAVPGHSGEELLRKEIDLSEAEYGEAAWTGGIRKHLLELGARILAAAMTSPAEIDAAIEDYVLDEGESPEQAARDCADFIIGEKKDRIKILIWGAFDTTEPERSND
jgi:hypothetical protein